MKREEKPEKERINPAVRRDRPGESHDDLAEHPTETDETAPRPYQEAELDPRDHGGIAE